MMDFVFKMLNPKDVLFLFYDELLTEHRGCVKRIAEFMQLSIDRSMILTHRWVHAAEYDSDITPDMDVMLYKRWIDAATSYIYGFYIK